MIIDPEVGNIELLLKMPAVGKELFFLFTHDLLCLLPELALWQSCPLNLNGDT